MKDLFDYHFYAPNYLKIRTKLDGLRPLILRKYQRRFYEFKMAIKGPKRIIVVKPRQCGFTTEVAGAFTHAACTQKNYSGIVLADKKGRTAEVRKVYQTYLENLPPALVPMMAANNTEKIWLENPDEKNRHSNPGLGNEILFETGNDPNAGRASPRKFAHISEAAFVRYMAEIDDGIQNSIPLAPETTIIKESTANGRAGVGRPHYVLWQAAKRGESIYKPFFVAWYEVDDYAIRPASDFKPTKEEIDILKQVPTVTEANLVWRRLKIQEYLNDDEETILTPDERFNQDFPLTDELAFLSTGAPVFCQQVVSTMINQLNSFRPNDIKDKLDIKSLMIRQYWDGLRIYTPPRDGKQYFIGADVAEGLAIGDASSCFVMDESYNQVARWHGKMDPDLFGHFLMALGHLYNTALIIPENNNMGHTVVTTIKNEGYARLYKEVVEDKVTRQITEKLGWRTTKESKKDMLNELVKRIREKEMRILDVRLPEEMALVSREENGTVNLNGRDRVVAAGLALMGRRQFGRPLEFKSKRPNGITGTGAEIHEAWQRKQRKQSSDIFG